MIKNKFGLLDISKKITKPTTNAIWKTAIRVVDQ